MATALKTKLTELDEKDFLNGCSAASAIKDTFSMTSERITFTGDNSATYGKSYLAGYVEYRRAVERIMNDFVDARILTILAASDAMNGIASSTSSVDSSSSVDTTTSESNPANDTDVDSDADTTTKKAKELNYNSKEELEAAVVAYIDFSDKNTLKTIADHNSSLLEVIQVMKDVDAIHTRLEGTGLIDLPAREEPASGGYSIGEKLQYRRNYPTPIYDVSDGTKKLYSYYTGLSGSNTDNVVDTKPTVGEVDLGSSDIIDTMSLMSNGVIQNGQIIINGDPTLRDMGYIILSAGALYDPFVSTAGNPGYMETIIDSIKSDSDFEKFTQILQTAINTKKPIYVTRDSIKSWASYEEFQDISMGEYRLAMLADVLETSLSITRAYAVVRGRIQPSAVDSSTWEYENKGMSSSGSKFSANPNPSTSTSNANSETDVDNNVGVTNANSSVRFTAGKNVQQPTVTVGDETITASSQQMTPPIMVTGGHKSGDVDIDGSGFGYRVGNLTTMIINNAAVDAKGNTHIENAESEQLFLNGLGDIVLQDDTIVLPAIANPIIYNYTWTMTSEDDFLEKFVESYDADRSVGYYPYTAAFMNHYPSGRINEDGNLEVTIDVDKDKYILVGNTGNLFAVKIKNTTGKSHTKDSDDNDSEDVKVYLSKGGSSVCANIIASSFRVKNDPGEDLSILQAATGRTFIDNWTPWDSKNFSNFITKGIAYNSEGINFFPLELVDQDLMESYLNLAGPVKLSAMRFLSSDAVGNDTMKPNSCFRSQHFIENMLGEGLLGTQYSATLVKNYQISYDDLVDDTGNRFLKFFVQITDSAIEHLGKIDGVLSIKGPYENSFFNMIYLFIQEFYMLIAVALVIIVASKFLRGHYNFLYVCFIGLLTVAGFQVYANILPTLLPSIYGFVVNDVIEDVVWDTVAYKAECYDEVYRDSQRIDVTSGNPKPYSATITLYKLSAGEMESVAGQVGVSYEEIKKGNAVYLDANAGIYVQGDCINMTIDRLFAVNSIRGLYQSQWDLVDKELTETMDFIPPLSEHTNDNPYSLQLTEPYVSLEAYYCPFDHIERAFMTKLNAFSNIFRIERNSFSYDNGKLYKDAFLVQSYIKSGIFTAPGDDDILKENINAQTILGDRTDTVEDLLRLCHQELTPMTDWLGITPVFEHPDDGLKYSLWGYMMQKRQWYDDDWNITNRGYEKLQDLIAYINRLTKIWVIDNLDRITHVSDENAIKLISLYATTCFTQYVSEIGDWLYPNYLNAYCIELEDILYSSLTSLHDRTQAYDGTVTNTVALRLGVFGIIFLLLIVLAATVFIFVITYFVPILYACLGGVFIFKLINEDSSIGLVQGYTKITLMTSILYFIFSLSLKLVGIGGYTWYSYLGCALIMYLCIYFLFWTVLSVIQDFTELGNTTLGTNLLHGLDKITRGTFNKIRANTFEVANNFGSNMRYGSSRIYNRSRSIDDYDRPWSRRSNGYNYSHDHYDPYRDLETEGYSRRTGFGFNSIGSRFVGRRSRAGRRVVNRRGWRSTNIGTRDSNIEYRDDFYED